MSTFLTGADRKLLIVTAAVSIALVTITGLLAPATPDANPSPTTYSAASGGAKAVYLLLSRLGYRVSRWERPLSELADPESTTLIIAEPEVGATENERGALALFMARGGRVILIGPTAGSFLAGDRIAADLEIAWKRLAAVSPSAITKAAPEIAMSGRANWTSGPRDVALPLYADAGKVRVIKEKRGLGELIWWAAATPLTNAGIRDANNLEFVLASIGEPGREVLWNEFVHGHETSTNSLARRAALWIGVHGIVAAIAILVTFSRRSGPILEPLSDSRLSPLEFVRTLGAVYERAGATSVAVDVAYRRFVYRLARRLGLPVTAAPEVLARAASWRWSSDESDLATLLAACRRAGDGRNLSPGEALQLTQQLAAHADRLGLSSQNARTTHPDTEARL